MSEDASTDSQDGDGIHTEGAESALPSPRERQLAGLRPWKPGQSGNPSGKPKDPLKLAFPRQFMTDLRRSWLEHGPEALAATARERPAEYVRVAASLIPREVVLSPGTGEGGSFLAALSLARAAETGEDPDPHLIEGEVVEPDVQPSVQVHSRAQRDAQPKPKPKPKPSASAPARRRRRKLGPPPPLEAPHPPDAGERE